MYIFKSIYKADITLEGIEIEKIELKKDLGWRKQGDQKDKSPKQKKTINNIKNLYNPRQGVVRMFNDYAKNMSTNIYDSKQGTELKILTPKLMLQIFPTAFVRIKAANNSERLLNEIRQTVYSLYQPKEITKKYIIA